MSVRSFLRDRFFRVLRKAFATDDGRRIAHRTLAGHFRPRLVLPDAERVPDPGYEGIRGSVGPAPAGDPFVVVTARFRTGSTLLWNLYRHAGGCTAYYEPFNERRYFDRERRGTRVDPSHVHAGVQWEEYDRLEDPDALKKLYDEDWIRRDLYMPADCWAPEMRRFIDVLVRGAKGLAVLQFNRVDFRLPWIRRNFPAARIIHLYRHPREQWCSTLLDIARYPADRATAEFAEHDGFYLLTWAEDLKYHFPFLAPEATSHAYEVFYYIWKLSYLFGAEYADHSVAFETLVADPAGELPRLFAASGLSGFDLDRLLPLVVQPRDGRWRDYASDDWFRRVEARCEQVLAEFFRQADADRGAGEPLKSAEPSVKMPPASL